MNWALTKGYILIYNRVRLALAAVLLLRSPAPATATETSATGDRKDGPA